MKTLTIYFKVLMLVKCLDCGGLGFLFLYAGISSIIEHGKQLGFSAAEKQLKFQLDVKFSSNERFPDNLFVTYFIA